MSFLVEYPKGKQKSDPYAFLKTEFRSAEVSHSMETGGHLTSNIKKIGSEVTLGRKPIK